MNCNCPAGFDKVQIRSRQDTIKNYASSNWYNLSSSFGYDAPSPEICTFNPLAAYESVNSCKKLSLGSGSGYNSGSYDNIFWVMIPYALSYDCEFGVPLKFSLIRFDVFTDTLHSDEKI